MWFGNRNNADKSEPTSTLLLKKIELTLFGQVNQTTFFNNLKLTFSQIDFPARI